MQKWEYLYILRRRGYEEVPLKNFSKASNWLNEIFASAGKRPYTYKDLEDALTNLGEEGWELVSISPRSDTASNYTAGFTDSEIWVFKRQKE
jgi:hypothetical protein